MRGVQRDLPQDPARLIDLYNAHGTWPAVADALNVPQTTIFSLVRRLRIDRKALNTSRSDTRLRGEVDWLRTDKDRLRRELQKHGSVHRFSLSISVGHGTTEKWVKHHGLKPEEWAADPDDYGIPRFGEDLVLEGDWAVTGDYHLPYSDPEMIRLLLRMSRAWGIKNLLIAGDFLDLDNFSKHSPLAPVAGWSSTKALATQTIHHLSEHFEQVVWTLGNHEQRITALTQGSWGIKELAQTLEAHNVRGVVAPGVVIATPNGPWEVVHPASYSRIPTRVAVEIAETEHRHVISFHGHLSGSRWDKSYQYRVVDAGMMGRANVAYRVLKKTTHPKWNQGFVFLKGGFAYPIDPKADLAFWEAAGGQDGRTP